MSVSETAEEQIRQVESFWNDNLCGSHFIDAELYTKEFFDDYTTLRYKKTHHLPQAIDWDGAKGKRILEIGLGIGADATMWAKHGAEYYGVDLTDEAVLATQLHFKYKGLTGQIQKGNAEALDFEDAMFDKVYSHGVLHHTTSIEKTFEEINRVLKPGGEFIVMLYAKGSFNYWVRIQLYFRLRLIFEIFRSQLGGKTKSKLWSEHVENFKRIGWSYLSWSNFPHRCTDGAGCEIANIYYKKEVIKLLNDAGFTFTKSLKAHFPLGGKYPGLERLISKYMGFHLICWARKN